MKQTFEVPGRLPGMNDYQSACRTNAYKGAKMKREAEDAVMWGAKAAGIKPMRAPIHIHTTYIEPNMRRDKDNIRTGVKFIQDALVKLGIIGDDGWSWIGGLDDCGLTEDYRINKKNPRIVVELMEI